MPTRKQLQKLAKKHGIRANLSSASIIEQLEAKKIKVKVTAKQPSKRKQSGQNKSQNSKPPVKKRSKSTKATAASKNAPLTAEEQLEQREERFNRWLDRFLDPADDLITPKHNAYYKLVGNKIPCCGQFITVRDPEDCGFFHAVTIRGIKGKRSTYRTSSKYEFCDHLSLTDLLVDHSWFPGNYAKEAFENGEDWIQNTLIPRKIKQMKPYTDFANLVKNCHERRNNGTVSVGDLLIKSKRTTAKLMVCERVSADNVKVRLWNSEREMVESMKNVMDHFINFEKAMKYKNNYFAIYGKNN